MDVFSNPAVPWTILAIVVIAILYMYMYDKKSFSSRNFDDSMKIPVVIPKAPANVSKFYGQDNPIVVAEANTARHSMMKKIPSSDEYLESILTTAGHISSADMAKNKNFHSKNDMKTARLSNQRVVSDSVETVAPYIGGTRSLAYSPNIDINEDRVPNRIQGPLKGLFAK